MNSNAVGDIAIIDANRNHVCPHFIEQIRSSGIDRESGRFFAVYLAPVYDVFDDIDSIRPIGVWNSILAH